MVRKWYEIFPFKNRLAVRKQYETVSTKRVRNNNTNIVRKWYEIINMNIVRKWYENTNTTMVRKWYDKYNDKYSTKQPVRKWYETGTNNNCT